jgi:ribosome-binding protein aMBF1 (putative translation factor)
MTSNEKITLIKQTMENVINYFTDQLEINQAALQAYDNDKIKDDDPEIRKMREIEAIKLRDRVNEITRHMAVLKRM